LSIIYIISIIPYQNVVVKTNINSNYNNNLLFIPKKMLGRFDQCGGDFEVWAILLNVGAILTGTIWPSTVQTLLRVWRYQRGNQNPYIKEERTTQRLKEKVQTAIYKTYTYTKDRVARTPLKTGV